MDWVAGLVGGGGMAQRVSGDEPAHALAVPHDLGGRVALAHELGEGKQVAIPILGVADVAAPRENRVAALAAHLIGIQAGARLMKQQVIA